MNKVELLDDCKNTIRSIGKYQSLLRESLTLAITSCVLRVQNNGKLQHQRSYGLKAKKDLLGLENFYVL